MGQMAKGLVNEQNMTSAHTEDAAEELDTVDVGKELERVKWFLWHGNVVRALDAIEDIEGERRARISWRYRSEPELHPKLWGSLPARREDFNGLRGVRGESSGEQAHGEEAANAMERVRRAQSAPGADESSQ